LSFGSGIKSTIEEQKKMAVLFASGKKVKQKRSRFQVKSEEFTIIMIMIFMFLTKEGRK